MNGPQFVHHTGQFASLRPPPNNRSPIPVSPPISDGLAVDQDCGRFLMDAYVNLSADQFGEPFTLCLFPPPPGWASSTGITRGLTRNDREDG